MSAIAQRVTARAVLFHEESKSILLFHIDDPNVVEPGKGRKKPFWVTPGGKVEEGENEKQALMRELEEETGLKENQVVFIDKIWSGECDLTWGGKLTHLIDNFFLVKATSKEIGVDGREEKEAAVIKRHKWFSLNELKSSNEFFIPKGLPDLLSKIVAGDYSLQEGIDLSAPEGLYDKV